MHPGIRTTGHACDPRQEPSTTAARARQRRRGQSLVEFALVFPIFFVMIMGLIEFAFVFNSILSVNYAARDAALAAAEAGNLLGADCVIIQAVDEAVGAPTADARIQRIEIYEADPNGAMIGSPTVYTRDNLTPNASPCATVDGSSVWYDRTSNGYVETSRCNILAGCDDAVVDSVDNVGVRITYTHDWVTPIRNFIGGGSGTLTFDRSSVMRMEPVL